jgi:hypothetical protein
MAVAIVPKTSNANPAPEEAVVDAGGFDALTLEEARQAVTAIATESQAVNEAFVEGDHWQDGDGWVGPQPSPEDDGFEETMSIIRDAFTSRNVIGEVVERHTAFLVGTEPRWGLTPRRAMKADEKPTNEEQALIDEAEAELTVWWDSRGVHGILQDLVRMVLWAERSAFRLYVPPGMLTRRERASGTVTLIEAKTLAEALSKLWPDHPSYQQATVIEDEDTKSLCGVFLFASDPQTGSLDRAELSFVAGEKTIIKHLGDADGQQRFAFALGGRIPMYEITRPLLVTEQIQQSQRALNLAASMLPRNVVTGGFLERILLNAQMPGEWEKNDRGDPIRFKPAPFLTGAGTTNFVTGVQYKDVDGKTVLTTPDVKWRDPISVDPAVAAKQEHYKDILEEAKQGHIIAGTDSKLGWKSREQLRADSDKALDLTRTPTEACGRWLLETALAMAEAFMGQPGHYTEKLRAEFTCIASSGPLSMDERKDNRDSAKDGFLSRSTTMERNGVADVDAELSRMAEETGARIDLAVKQATALKTLTDAGADLAGAARFIGIDEDRAKLLMQADLPGSGQPIAQ